MFGPDKNIALFPRIIVDSQCKMIEHKSFLMRFLHTLVVGADSVMHDKCHPRSEYNML